jgi:hypothetical protein
MQLDAALTTEQGITFVVVAVKRHALNAPGRDDLTESYSELFDGVPTVIMARDSRGTPEYYGRHDIVNFLSDVPPEALPWRTWTFTDA